MKCRSKLHKLIVLFPYFVIQATYATELNHSQVLISAFRDICLATAPTFEQAEAAAKKYGIESLEKHIVSYSGMTADKRMRMQLKPKRECVITTENLKDDDLTSRFISLVSEFSKLPLEQKVPTKAVIGSNNFVVMHDRNGGEAFVILKLDR